MVQATTKTLGRPRATPARPADLDDEALVRLKRAYDENA
jgi:hypothetical protein